MIIFALFRVSVRKSILAKLAPCHQRKNSILALVSSKNFKWFFPAFLFEISSTSPKRQFVDRNAVLTFWWNYFFFLHLSSWSQGFHWIPNPWVYWLRPKEAGAWAWFNIRQLVWKGICWCPCHQTSARGHKHIANWSQKVSSVVHFRAIGPFCQITRYFKNGSNFHMNWLRGRDFLILLIYKNNYL